MGNNDNTYQKRWIEGAEVEEKEPEKPMNIETENSKEVATESVIKQVWAIPLPQVKLRLNTVSNVRKSAAKLIRLFLSGYISQDVAKVTGYQIQTLLQAYKAEAELSVQAEIAELKELVKEQYGNQKRR